MTSLAIWTTRALIGALVFTTTLPSPGLAQTIDPEALQAAADTGDTEAQRNLGEALLYGFGGVEQDIDAGLALLRQAAAGGNIAAKASLGKILLDGYYATADPETAEALLSEAAEAGNTRAQASLGSALVWGTGVDADPARAEGLLTQAAEKEDTEALRVLGEQLVGGWVFERDTVKGLGMLEQAVADGDTEAKIALGSFLLYGNRLETDLPRALALFEEAADEGDGRGLERYGTVLMWSERDAAASETYLRRAGEMGVGAAWSSLAEGAIWGYLGRNSRQKFQEFAEKALEAGETKIAVLEAHRRMWGISMRASGPHTLEGLEQAADEGNAEAAKFLIALVRNGNQLNIRKEPDRARGYLDRYSELLTPTEIAQYAFTIDAAEVRNVPAYVELAQEYESRPELKSVWFGQELYAANPNFAIYLMQIDLQRRGIYAGSLNGLATRSTIRAISHECYTLEDTWQCTDTVLHPDVIGPLLAR